MGYTLTDHTQVPNLIPQVTRLTNAAFAEYEGAMTVDEAWTAWYLKRPGTDPTLCQAALEGDTLVSQVLVCVQTLQLGGELLRCGIIDSVATDPGHRRRGLARALMERAHEAMSDAGVEAAVLYTNPEGPAYGLYERLGYVTRARGAMFQGPRPEGGGGGPVVVDARRHGPALQALLNDYFGAHEGYAPLDDALWRWHRLDPPAGPPTVVAEMTNSGPTATATFARAEVNFSSGTRAVAVAYDIAARSMNEDMLTSLLAAAPEETVLLILDERAPECEMAVEAGLEREVGEVAMVLPLVERARTALESRRGPWYFMVESLVGV